MGGSGSEEGRGARKKDRVRLTDLSLGGEVFRHASVALRVVSGNTANEQAARPLTVYARLGRSAACEGEGSG